MSKRRSDGPTSAPVAEPWILPSGWHWTRLGEYIELIRGVSYGKDQASTVSRDGYVPMLRGGNIQHGKIDYDDILTVSKSCVRTEQHLRIGDIVCTMSSGSSHLVGKTAIIRKLDSTMTFGAFCAALRPTLGFSEWIGHFANTHIYRELLSSSAKGTNINNLKREHILDIPLPIAPIDCRDKIVGRVEELLTIVHDGETALARARADLEVYRRSLLKAAVMGELTADWRAANPAQETGTDLLSRILGDRRARWHADDRNKGKVYAEPQVPNDHHLPSLPHTWTWATLDQVCTHITSGSRAWSAYYDLGQSVFIMAQNVRRGRYDHSHKQLVGPPQNDSERNRTRVFYGDLLLTIVGANTGDLCLVDFQPDDFYVCQSVALLRPVEYNIGKFVNSFFANEFGRVLQMQRLIYGAGRPHLSFDQIRSLAIPLCPLAEMQQITLALDGVQDHLSECEDELRPATEMASTLRQSILAAAFRGELVA